MNCYNCGSELAKSALRCDCCGAIQDQTTVLDASQMPNYQGTMPQQVSNYQNIPAQQQAINYQPYQNTTMTQSISPALKLDTNRSLVKMIFLSLITFGIYGIVIWSRIVDEINITASRYDGKKTCPYFATLWLTMLTYGIFALVWQHNFSNRVGAEVKRRGYDYNFSASDFWLWGILGSLIIVGPLVYCHKLMKAMNMINENYNIYG